MKKETRYEMLSHIDPKYLDEAYPKKRNIASILIPVAACACLMAILAPTVISTLRPEAKYEGINSADDMVLEADKEVLQQESQENIPPQTSAQPSVEPERPPTNQKPQAVPSDPSIEPITLTPIVIEDSERDTYLEGYTSLFMGKEGELRIDVCYAVPPETETVIFTWGDVVDFFGTDVRPEYIPNTLTGKDLKSADFTFNRVTEANAPYEVGDYYNPNIGMVYKEDLDKELSPTNRGIYICARKAINDDLTQTMRYRMTLNAKDSLSYYNDVPVLFYVPSDRITSSVMDGSEALGETNDIHLTEEYQALLTEFLYKRPALTAEDWTYQARNDWNSFLKKNGIPEGEPTFNEKSPYSNQHYFAILIHNGIEYTLESNLDFETFAAITASLIHD